MIKDGADTEDPSTSDDDHHDDVLDAAQLGGEPSAEYQERVRGLDAVVRECISISRAYSGIPSPTGKHYYGSVLFTALLTKAVSLLIAAPHSPWANKIVEHWDYATLTGIVRTMLEIRLAFFYLCVEDCSEEEWKCRWNIFNLHDCLAREKLFNATGAKEEVEKLAVMAEELRARLAGNEFFKHLPTGQKKNIFKGKTAFLSSLEEIGERAGLARDQFQFLYILFSSHVHGLPMSFYRIGEERGTGLPTPTEENYSSLCLSFALSIIVRARDEMRALFVEFLEKEKKIREAPSDTELISVMSNEQLLEPKTVFDDGIIRMVVTQPDKKQVEITYFSSDEVVLRRSLSDDDNSTISEIDPIFWSISVNGAPVTAKRLNEIERMPKAFKVDHHKRSISFKIRSEPA